MKPSEYLYRAHEAGVPLIQEALQSRVYLDDIQEHVMGYCALGVLALCSQTPFEGEVEVIREVVDEETGQYSEVEELDIQEYDEEQIAWRMAEHDPDLDVLTDYLSEEAIAFLDEMGIPYGDGHVWEAVFRINDFSVPTKKVGVWGHEYDSKVYLTFREQAHILSHMGY